MKIEPINRTKISEQVFEQMKQQILLGEWKPGSKLPSETELATIFSVSRVTIRQALQKLTILGLIETKFGEGSFVLQADLGSYMNTIIPVAYLNLNSIIDILDFRCVIEIETAGLAAERATPENVRTFIEQLEKMEALKNESWKFALADLEFHFLIAKTTHNSLIIQTYNILRDILAACMKDTVESLGIEVGIPYHRSLIRAFSEHDAPLAKQVMREHMESTREQFKKANMLD